MPELSRRGKQIEINLRWAIREGYKPTQYYNLIKGTPLGYRKQDFLRDWKILEGKVQKADRMKYIPKNKIISEKWYERAVFRLPQEFMTRAKLKLRVLNTGEIIYRDIWVSHNRLLTVNEMVNEAYKELQRQARKRGIHTWGLELVGGWAEDARRTRL